MGKIKRTTLILFCVSALLSIGFLVLNWLSISALRPALSWLTDQLWFPVLVFILIGIVMLGILFILFWAIFSPRKSSQLLIEDGSNLISITKEAIISTARHTVMSQSDLTIKDMHLKITGRRNPKMKLRVKLDVGSHINLKLLGEDLAASLRSSVETLTGIPLNKVRVTFTKSMGQQSDDAFSNQIASPSAGTIDESESSWVVSAR